MSAFRHAMTSGVDGFEFDVRATSDGKLACVHDAAVGEYLIAHYSYEQLCNVHLKTAPGPDPAIPRLEDVLREFASSAFLDIEIKVEGLEKSVLNLLQQYSPQRFVVSSFLAEVVLDLAEADPRVPLGFIFDDVIGLRTSSNLPVRYLMPRSDLLTRELVEAFHRDGYKVLAWTVNHTGDMKRLAEWGVDGLISDDPALLSETMGGR